MLYMFPCNSHSGLKVSDPMVSYILYEPSSTHAVSELWYIPYAMYVAMQDICSEHMAMFYASAVAPPHRSTREDHVAWPAATRAGCFPAG